jgi:hypothetical protein
VQEKQVSEGDADRGAKGDADPCFHAILDRAEQSCPLDTLEINVSIRAFITGGLACCTCALGKEGVDKAHRLWCKLKSAEWQAHGHARGVKWTLEELKCIARSLGTDEAENGVKTFL